MKRLFLSIVMSLAFTVAAMALEHTVQRGETLESVAKTYNISTAQLLEANPGAKTLFYVGLKLNIPDNVTTKTQDSSNKTYEPLSPQPSDNKEKAPSDKTDSETTVEEEQPSGPGWGYGFEISYGFLPKIEGIKNTSHFTYAISLGGSYWFKEMMTGPFAFAGFGYDSAFQGTYYYDKSTFTTYSTSAELYMLTVPLKVGYALSNTRKNFAIVPYVGIDMSVSIAAKLKIDDKKIKGDTGKFIPTFKAGAIFRLGGFDVGFYYRVHMGDKAKAAFGEDGHFGVNIGFGF